jgi:hypothetical protein
VLLRFFENCEFFQGSNVVVPFIYGVIPQQFSSAQQPSMNSPAGADSGYKTHEGGKMKI